MTVVCINDKWEPENELIGSPSPAVGDKDVVTDIVERRGDTFYILQRFGRGMAFLTTHFVDIDDTPAEVIEETETELQTA